VKIRASAHSAHHGVICQRTWRWQIRPCLRHRGHERRDNRSLADSAFPGTGV